MAFFKHLAFPCWCLLLMTQCSYSYADDHGSYPENSRQEMTPRKVQHHQWKQGHFNLPNSGKAEQVSTKNDEDILEFKPESEFHENGIKTSVYRGMDVHPSGYVAPRNLMSNGKGSSETTSSVNNSNSSRYSTKENLGQPILENVTHPKDDMQERRQNLGFGNLDKEAGEVVNDPSDIGPLGDVRFTDFPCGPQKKCSCNKSLKFDYLQVNCSGQGLTEFPTSLPSKARLIDLSSNKISYLSLESLSLYGELGLVFLAHNNITNITVLTGYKKVVQLVYLDLSYNKLTDLTHIKLFSGLESLFLAHNCITDINYTYFLGMERLNLLDISHNDLRRINEAAFDSLVNLKELYLHSNAHLGYSDKIFSARLFVKLDRLKILWIQNNANKNKDKTYPNKALGKLINLQELAIDGLDSSVELGEELENVPHLNRLLIGYLGKCYIETIGPNFFDHVGNLTSLVFSRCSFTSDVSPEAFMKIRKLKEYAITFPGEGYQLSKAFQDLEGLLDTNVTSLSLEGFKKKYDQCRTLTFNDIRYIRDLNLTRLSLNYNYISHLEYQYISHIPVTVETLLFRCNSFATINEHYSVYVNLTSLHEIDLRDQNVNCSTIVSHEQLQESIPSLRSPLASPFALPVDDYIRPHRHDVQEAACAKHEETMCRKGHLWEHSYESNCDPKDVNDLCIPPNLHVIKASGYTQFGQAILTRRLSPNKLCYLDLSRGYFTTWGKGTIPKGVRVADLGDNFCNTLRPETFHTNNSLRYLCIQNNYLGQVFANDVNGKLFSRLNHLKHLNIAGNRIYHLSPDFFNGLRNLKVLKLMDNRLEKVVVNFSVMPKLRSIDLSNNAIKWISRFSRGQLDELAKDHRVTLHLGYNPLPCTCKGIELLQWLEHSRVRIKDLEFLTCKDENEDVIHIRDLYERLSELKRRCIASSVLITASSFCCAIFVIIIVAGMLYKHRWKLIYAKNTWLVKVFGFHPGGRTSSHHAYDAYVVYCQEDTDFALDKMVEELEVRRGHRLCLEDRDFIPGSFNFNNITCAIKNSTTTLLLLSPGFVRTKELEYAMQMALMEQYNNQRKRDLILLFCYREVPDREMTKDLLLLMRQGRFLDYPDDQDDSVMQRFWDRLSEEIGHTTSTRNDDCRPATNELV